MGALEGITRNTVMELATELGIPVKQRVMSRHDLFTSDECFLTGTAAEVIPVTEIDGRTIGGGEIGKTTLTIRKAFIELTQTKGAPVLK